MTEPALANRTEPPSLGDCLWAIATIVAIPLAILLVSLVCGGCAYKGGKVIDGTNLAIGITIPGTEWTINALDFVGGVRVAGNNMTYITVTNEVAETNRYFGVVETNRRTKMTARIEPCDVKNCETEPGDR